MKTSLFILSIISSLLLTFCKGLSPKEQVIRDNINKTIHLDMFDSLQCEKTFVLYSKWKKIYKYITIVSLQASCSTCYSKYIEWQTKMDSVNKCDDYTVLFIVRGENFKDFVGKLSKIDMVKNRYYFVIDPENKFMRYNNIPEWIIESSILIDDKNRIKLIGEPYANPQMTDLFYNVLKH